MKITVEWLLKEGACPTSIGMFAAQSETDGIKLVEKLVAKRRYEWANWLLAKLLSASGCVAYAIYAAEQVLPIWEHKCPNDKRPHLAIEAARRCLANAPDAAAYAATAAAASWAVATYAFATAAAVTIAGASWAAAAAAAAAASGAADASRWAALSPARRVSASRAVIAANAAAAEEMQREILKYGVKLLKETI